MYFLYPQDGGVYQFSDPNSQFENFKFSKNFFLNTGILTTVEFRGLVLQSKAHFVIRKFSLCGVLIQF